jgi:hypothetical protein
VLDVAAVAGGDKAHLANLCLNLSVVCPHRYRTRVGVLKYPLLKNTVMYISRFQLLNYKSFRDSRVLEFQPGINIIVRANNSGKTALLEALTLNFKTSPHRSIETLPQPYSTPIRVSIALPLLSKLRKISKLCGKS